MFTQDVFERLGLSQNTDLLQELQKDALLEPGEAKQSPYMDDPAYAGFETLRGLFGSGHGENPSMYWLAQGEEMPEFSTVADAQAAVWEDFKGKTRTYKAERERQEKAREALTATIDPLIDRYVRGGAVIPSPEQMAMMQEAGISWESIKKARKGRQLVQEYDAQGALYDDRIINNLADQVGDDEVARNIVLNMFYNDARQYARDKHGDEWTGVGWVDNAAQGLTGLVRTGQVKMARGGQRAWRNLQKLGEMDAVTNAAKRLPELIASGMNDKDARAQIEQDAKALEVRRRWATDLIQTMEAGEQEYLESHDRHLIGRIGSQLGSIAGDTAPWFIPVIGPAIGMSAATQSRREEGTAMGLSMQEVEKRAIMFGQADALEEMIAFSPIGRLTPGYKLLKRALGSGKAAEKLAPWRTKWLTSPKGQFVLQGISGTVEEAVLEPTAGYLMRTVQSMNLTDERGKQTFQQYLGDMSQMMHGEQGLALLAFTFGMSGFNYPQIKRAAQEFGLSLQHYKELGGTEQGFLDARSEKTADGFLNKALANLHDAWMTNPQRAMEQAHEAVKERISAERIQSLRELDSWKAAEAAGEVPRVEPAEQDGMFRVYAPVRGAVTWDKEGNPVQSMEKASLETVTGGKIQQEDTTAPETEGKKAAHPFRKENGYTLMNEEQMTAYLQTVVGEYEESLIVGTQNLLAGKITVEEGIRQGLFDAAEVITDESGNVTAETLGQLKARSGRAMAAIRALEAEGMSYVEAARQVDPSISEHIPLGAVAATWFEAQERVKTERARNPEYKVPAMDAKFSRAYVTKYQAGSTYRRILRYAGGQATVEDFMEETMEQAVISWCNEQTQNVGDFGALLQEAQRTINELYPDARAKEMQFIHLDEKRPVTAHDAVEAFSMMGRSRWLADAVESSSLPGWLRKLLNHLVQFLGYFKAKVELGNMLRKMDEAGQLSLPIRQMMARMLDAGNALYRDQQGDLIALTMERAKAQADLDAALGRGVATEQEAVEEQLAERNAADEPGPVDRAEDEADDANAQQARRERTEAEVEMLGERDDDGVFNGGVSIRIEDGVRQGFIDKDRLTLCPDVPQFKQGADEKTGVVNRIVGAWQRNASPISVWRRTDGSLQVISGRHRLDACTDADINCTVYEEGGRFNLDWARRHDVENNIRDGQASAFEIARYVRDSSLSMAEAVERGIARKGSSLKGVELGLYASQDLLDALGNGLVSPDDAYRVALAFRNDAEVQRSGLAVLLDGGSWQEAYNTMAAKANLEAIARQNAANGMDMGMDLFGNTDNEELYKRIGKYAAEKYRELGKELTAINGASRNPKVARKYGVNVNDAAAVQQVVKRLQEERARWKNFAVHPDLLKEANDAVMVEMGLKSREDVDRENGVLPLEESEPGVTSSSPGTLMLSRNVSRMLDDFMNRENTHFSLAGENEALLAPNGKPSNLTPEQYRQVRTPEFKRWFGDWEKVATFKDAYERIMTMPPVTSLTGQEFQKDGVPLTEKVTRLWKERFNGVAISPELGEVRLDLEGVKSSIGHGIGSLKSAAFACVEDVIRNGIVFDRQENWKGRGYDTAVIAAPVTIKDVEYICEVVVEQRSNRQGFYLHEVEIKKKLEDVFKTSTEGGTSQASRSILALRAEDVKREEENMSKVVDENGEPLVVYHGTSHEFTVFNKHAGSAHDAGYYGQGFYFTFQNNDSFKPQVARAEAEYYGNRIIPAFLNLKNPFDFSSLKEYRGEHIGVTGAESLAFLYNIAKKFPELEGVVEMPQSGKWVNGFFEVDEKGYSYKDYVNLVESIYDKLIVQKVNDRGEEKLYIEYWDGKSYNDYEEDGETYRYKKTSTIYRDVSPESVEKRKKEAVFAVLEKVYGLEVSYYPEGIMTRNPEITEAIKAHGHDGIVQSLSGDEVVVFEPNQIKSATDNRGTFDPGNPDITFSIRTEEPPKKTGIGYKVCYQKDGKLYPPMVANPDGKDTPVGVWLDADEGVRAGVSKTGRPRVKAGGKGTQGGSGTLAYRPGFHLGEIPYALQFNRRNPQTGERNLFPADFVWAEVEYAADHDYQEEAMSYGINPSGKFQHSLAGLPRIPKDGFYKYRTNPNPQTDPWIITGAIKVLRVLSKEEVDNIVRKAGREPQVMEGEYPNATFSIIGEKAESFLDYHNNGLSYMDPADGKQKAIIDSRGVRLKKERMGLSEGGHVNVSLSASLDFPELFRAYPELQKLRVDFYRDPMSDSAGFTSSQENYVAVNVARGKRDATSTEILDTVLHEVQHMIQLHEGFALGTVSMSQEQAMDYLDASIAMLHGRDDAWARAARPRLKSMRADVASGVLDPAMIYFFSHGEQEARLAGRFGENGTGVVMSGLNGFRLLDNPAFTVPLTGNITELGGITFGAGRFGRMADRILSTNGDWLYDEMVFRMRAATQRAVKKLDLYHAGNREAGLEMIAECQELISTVERYLPHTYGFGLEPYKIWLNVFSLLYGGGRRGDAAHDIVSDALAAIPMSKWPEIMEGSFIKNFVKWAKSRPELEDVIEEARREIVERQSDYELDSAPDADNKAARAARKGVEREVWHKLFLEYGTEFLEEYGEQKVYRLIGKFMSRVVEQIDRYRKDRTLGRIRRVVAAVSPKRTPRGKPLRGKMDAAAYEKLTGYMQLLEMTAAQHEEFFRKKYPVRKDQETGEEIDPWDQVKTDDMVSIVLPDDEGKPVEVTVSKLAFETYACYEQMNVERAECCARALGELISTSRDAWENARVKKQQELEAMLTPVFDAAGRTDASARGAFRTLDKLKNPVKWTLGLLDGFMNGYQYFDSLARVKPFAGIARHFADRLATAEANVGAEEKAMILARANAAAEASGLTDEYNLADWVLERRKKRDTGIVIMEQEPDWAAQARQKYRDGLMGLVRRKERKHGADKVMAQAAALIRMDERMKSELDLFWPASGGWEFDRERDAVVFTEGELKRYGNQQEYVREHAEQERGRSKYAREDYAPRSMPLDALSRMEAAYLILLHEQADYTDAMRLLGFTPEVMDQLRDFAGEDVITFSYALRDALNRRSQDVKNAMERKTGMPFPLVENYFRAFFDVGFQSIEKTILDAASFGEAAGGGKFGMTYARKKHRLHLDLNMDVCTAFDAAMREQTLFLHMSDVSNDLRRLLSYRGEAGDAGAALEKLLGRDALSKLKAWSDAMDRAGAETVIGHLHANRLINAVSSAAARTLLPGRVGTWVKQWTGVLNTLHASDALDASDWLGSMKRAAAGRLVMPVREMRQQPELSSRYKGMSALNEAMNADGAGRHVSCLGKANRKAMEDIERRDMQANAISCAVLYDAMYRKVQREDPDAGKAGWHEAAMMEVRRSLSGKGQPMVLTQRSLNAQTRQWMTVGMFFLGGESINTFAKCLSLFRRGEAKHAGRGASVWVAHGLLVALMDGLLHWFTDDEKKRKRRSAWDLLYYTIAGPLAGIPIVSGLLGDGLESLGRAAGLKVWNPKDSSLIPLSNWSDVARAGKRVARAFDGKPHDWTDYPLAFADALRVAAAGSIAFNARSSKAGAAVEGAALTVAAFVNLMEFALKTVRRVSE